MSRLLSVFRWETFELISKIGCKHSRRNVMKIFTFYCSSNISFCQIIPSPPLSHPSYVSPSSPYFILSISYPSSSNSPLSNRGSSFCPWPISPPPSHSPLKSFLPLFTLSPFSPPATCLVDLAPSSLYLPLLHLSFTYSYQHPSLPVPYPCLIPRSTVYPGL